LNGVRSPGERWETRLRATPRQPRLAGLRAEAQADLLGERRRRQITVRPTRKNVRPTGFRLCSRAVAGHRSTSSSVRPAPGLPDAAGRTDRVTHVVQAVETGTSGRTRPGKSFARPDLEPRPLTTPASAAALRAATIEGSCGSSAHERGPLERLRHDDVDAPRPQPTSATFSPLNRSLSTTPSRAGSHSCHQVGGVPGPEQPQHPGEQPVVVLLPAHARAGAERVHDASWSA